MATKDTDDTAKPKTQTKELLLEIHKEAMEYSELCSGIRAATGISGPADCLDAIVRYHGAKRYYAELFVTLEKLVVSALDNTTTEKG